MGKVDRFERWQPGVLLISHEEFLSDPNPYNDRSLANNFDYAYLNNLGREIDAYTHSAILRMTYVHRRR